MVNNQVKIINIFSDFKKESGMKIPRPHYYKLYSLYCLFLYSKIIEGIEVSLPSNLGTIQILGKKINFSTYTQSKHNREIDWEQTNKLRAEGKKGFVYFLNEDSNYIRYKVNWNNVSRPLINKGFYKFTSCRNLKRSLAKNIKEGKEYLIK